MRTFDSGATRDSDEDKLDYEGFLSPLVLKRFAEYMHHHRRQADGNLRPADNWQKGMPRDAYMASMWRHFMDVWMCHDGWPIDGTFEDALCALWFNVQGYLFEQLKEKQRPTATVETDGTVTITYPDAPIPYRPTELRSGVDPRWRKRTKTGRRQDD